MALHDLLRRPQQAGHAAKCAAGHPRQDRVCVYCSPVHVQVRNPQKWRTVESRPYDECNGRRCDAPSSARSRTPVGAASQLVVSWPPGDNVLPTMHSHRWASISNPCINRSRFGNMAYRSTVFGAVLKLLVVRRQLHRRKVVAGQGRRRRRRPRATQGSPGATAAAWFGEKINC